MKCEFWKWFFVGVLLVCVTIQQLNFEGERVGKKEQKKSECDNNRADVHT